MVLIRHRHICFGYWSILSSVGSLKADLAQLC